MTTPQNVSLYSAPANIDADIAYLARVSSEFQDNPNYEGLLKYLIKHGHWSPFDMQNIVIEFNTQKDIGIQLLRHPTLKPQEWSQRYADCSDMRAPLRECRLQDETNRQNSLTTDDLDLIEWWRESQRTIQNTSFTLYAEAIEKGIAKEVARALLPIGLTNTKMYFNASVRSWLFYCKSRMHNSTQKEHRRDAQQVMRILKQVAPCTAKAFVDLHMSGDEYIFEETHEV